MECDKLFDLCMWYNIKNIDCKEMYLRCRGKETNIKKRKSLRVPLSKIGVERKSGVFSSNPR